MSLNRFSGIGNLTRDPELKFTPKGTAVCEIGLAMNRNYTTESGERREEVVFVSISYFGPRAETLAKWTKKGKPLYVEARLKNETWDDKTTGEKRTKLALIGENFQFLGGKDSDSEPAERPRRPAERPTARREAPPRPPRDADLDADDDDIPF